jgi:hypothetical protein
MNMFKLVALIDSRTLDLCAFVEGIVAPHVDSVEDPAYMLYEELLPYKRPYPVFSYVEHLHTLPIPTREQYIDEKVLSEYLPDVPVTVEIYDEVSGEAKPIVIERGSFACSYAYELKRLGITKREESLEAYANALTLIKKAPSELSEAERAGLARASKTCFVLQRLAERLSGVSDELSEYSAETHELITELGTRARDMLVKLFTSPTVPGIYYFECGFDTAVAEVLRRIDLTAKHELFTAELEAKTPQVDASHHMIKRLWSGIIDYAKANTVAAEITEPGEMRALLSKLVGGLWNVRAQLSNFYQESEVPANYYLSAIALMALSQVEGMRGNAVYKAFCTDFADVLKSKGVPEVWQTGFYGACFGDSVFQLEI